MRNKQAAQPTIGLFLIDHARLNTVLERSQLARERSQELLASLRAARG